MNLIFGFLDLLLDSFVGAALLFKMYSFYWLFLSFSNFLLLDLQGVRRDFIIMPFVSGAHKNSAKIIFLNESLIFAEVSGKS